jgi:hypothetical protein
MITLRTLHSTASSFTASSSTAPRSTAVRAAAVGLATAALVLTPLTAADAASRYKVSAGVSDRSLDLTSHDGSNRSTVIKGTVRGGKVKGKKVYIYASNTSARQQGFRYIGSDRLSSSGRFAKTWKPKDGGSYVIKVVKRKGSGRSQGTDSTRVNVFQFVSLTEFYDNDPAKASSVRRVDKAGSIGGQNWSRAYEIDSGSSAVFTTQGYRCFRINFKIGVSDAARPGSSGSYAVTQGGRTIASGSHAQGQRFVEPTSTEAKRMRADQPVVVTVSGAPFVLGLPKAACTYPTRTAPVR